MRFQQFVVVALIAVLTLASCATARSEDSATGAWSLETVNSRSEFSMSWSDATGDHENDSSSDVDIHALGIDAALASSGSHVKFAQHRESGDCTYEGWVANGNGGGTFVYTPNGAFFDYVRKRGLVVDSMSQQLRALVLDVTRRYVDSILATGVKLDTFHDVLRLRAMNVDSGYIHDLASVGFAHLDAHDYLRLKALNVDSTYIKYLQGHGMSNLTVREVVRLKAQQI